MSIIDHPNNPYADLGGGINSILRGEKMIPDPIETVKSVTTPKRSKAAQRAEQKAIESGTLYRGTSPSAEAYSQRTEEDIKRNLEGIQMLREKLAEYGGPVVARGQFAIEQVPPQANDETANQHKL